MGLRSLISRLIHDHRRTLVGNLLPRISNDTVHVRTFVGISSEDFGRSL